MQLFYFKIGEKQETLLEFPPLFVDNQVRISFRGGADKPIPFHPFLMSIFSDPEINLEPNDLPEIPLPKGWTELTLQAVLHVITLARIVLLNASVWPDGPECDTLRLRAENDRLKSEIALLKCELEIKDARLPITSNSIHNRRNF